MTEKFNENIFKFSIYQGDCVVSERIFNANDFNPVIRYSVDIRSIIPEIIQKLQITLSKRNLTFNKIDEKAYVDYNFLRDYQDVCYNFNLKPIKLKKPYYIRKEINGKVIEGTQCRFGLYINNNPIVERDFHVDKYNPAVRFSYEIVETTRDLVDFIVQYLKEMDSKHMWDDYKLIKTYSLYINQIRELTDKKRNLFLNKIDDGNFIRKIKNEYRTIERENRGVQQK
jgi:hypothetical protein